MWIGIQTANLRVFRITETRLLASLIVTRAFTLLARYLKAVSRPGAWAGAFICFFLCLWGGLASFAALVSVFVLAWASTRFGYQRKQKLGTAEKIGGRDAWQVVANLGVGCACAFLYTFTRRPVFLLAIAASLSEAAADTVSSEIGQISRRRPRLITTWKAVPAGTDGAITLTGTLAGLAAAMVVTIVCVITGMLPWSRAAISVCAALGGTITDSFLGALLERRKLLNNDAVNFFGTLIAAIIAIAFV